MKKITYLVAPLMVLPFLVGCKGAAYKVSVADVSDKHLAFKSQDGKKDLKDVKAEKGKDFVFTVQAVQENADVTYRVIKDYVFVAVGGNVLYDGVSIKYGGEGEVDHSYATVTVAKDKVTADILVGGMAGKEGYYIYNIPYSLGIEVTSVTQGEEALPLNYGYAKCDTSLVIAFTGSVAGAAYSNDAKEWKLADESSGGSGQAYVDGGHVTVKKEQIADSITIMARGGDDKWLDLFEWSDIKTISEMGAAPTLFAVGDTKDILVNGHLHEVEIVGFNHDYTEEGEGTDRAKAGITFKFNTILSDKDGNAIPAVWGKSHQDFTTASLNEYLNKDVFGMLPDELKTEGMIKTVYKPVGVYTSSTGWKAKEYPTQLFPLSVVETGLTATYDVSNEGTAYGTETVRPDLDLIDVNGNHRNYWLRSPNTETDFWGDTYNYSYVIQNSEGSTPSLGRLAATSSRYVVPCFCI